MLSDSMNIRKSILIALLAVLIAGPAGHATTVGLSSGSVNSIYAEQKQSEWCWAACIQMIANLYGADLTQDEVVARSYGPGANHAGSLEVITANLNGSGTTRSGRRYSITSTMLGNRMLPAALVSELTAGHPVLLGCDAGGSGHAMVCTAVSYDGPIDHPTITALTVRDPWPCNENRDSTGRHVVSGSDLGPRIMEGWVIRIVVHDTDGQVVTAPQGYTFDDSNTMPNTALSFVSNPTRNIVRNPVPNRPPSASSNDDVDAVPEPPRRFVTDVENVLNDMMTLLSSK